MKVLVAILVMMLGWSQYLLWISPEGLPKVSRLRTQLQQQTQANQQLQHRNDEILADIRDLRSGNQAIEERARHDLGMVKRGETFYQVVE